MNRNTTLILVGVFAALFLYVLLVQKPADDAKANATPTLAPVTTGTVLGSLTPDQVLEISIRDSATQKQVSFGRLASAAAWEVFEPEQKVADQVAAATQAANLTNLTYDQVITSTQDLAAFGILSPTTTLAIAVADGSTINITIGDKTPTGTGYYVVSDKVQGVMVVNTYGLDAILKLIDEPPYIQMTATPEGLPVLVTSTAPAPTPTP